MLEVDRDDFRCSRSSEIARLKAYASYFRKTARISRAAGFRQIDACLNAPVSRAVGPVVFGSDKVPPFAARNIAKTPLVGGQWRLTGDKYNMVITENKQAPQIPLGGDMQALS